MSLKADQCKGEGVLNNHAHFACDFVTFHLKINDTVILQKNASDMGEGRGAGFELAHKHGDPWPFKTRRVYGDCWLRTDRARTKSSE